jgi:hypothetical protein
VTVSAIIRCNVVAVAITAFAIRASSGVVGRDRASASIAFLERFLSRHSAESVGGYPSTTRRLYPLFWGKHPTPL